MKISVVVDNPKSWFLPFASDLVKRLSKSGETSLLQQADEIPAGTEVAFLLSCERKVPSSLLARSRHNIVVHASHLPRGKGMSPLTWQILEGKNEIPLTLFEAVEAIDAGPVYLQDSIRFSGSELLPEMQAQLGNRVVDMCSRFAREYPAILQRGQPQKGSESFYRRRKPEDSRLDPDKTIAEQFDLLRVVDNERYPAFFEYRGRRYLLTITAASARAEVDNT